ncbi:nicotinate-nucleotide adenylyltransferase [Sporosalibacterium faouarense]|uniref:nicotinate-nucleotide adenylyltransferase n=1 Tax=Sporosalibacterium faouarense TaxID=516123 RepID=UPI00192C2EAD|nr:nicotinate-nucleotide adenylyltransferase [Sporosalibacterium faouarense]
MSDKSKKYGIMGGTFDPIHIGHLVIAEEVRNKFNLDKVIFIPSGQPPHKNLSNVTEPEHRYQMTLLATISNPYFEVSSIEMDRAGKTYTVDTIKKLNEVFNEEVDFYFITGADAILDLPTWKNVNELLTLCNFVAATRPGFGLEKMQKGIEKLEKKYNRSIYTLIVPALQISSTDIRNRINNNQSIKYLLPESVEHYIYKNNLYKSSENGGLF